VVKIYFSGPQEYGPKGGKKWQKVPFYVHFSAILQSFFCVICSLLYYILSSDPVMSVIDLELILQDLYSPAAKKHFFPCLI